MITKEQLNHVARLAPKGLEIFYGENKTHFWLDIISGLCSLKFCTPLGKPRTDRDNADAIMFLWDGLEKLGYKIKMWRTSSGWHAEVADKGYGYNDILFTEVDGDSRADLLVKICLDVFEHGLSD
jgi:hypothetical protein